MANKKPLLVLSGGKKKDYILDSNNKPHMFVSSGDLGLIDRSIIEEESKKLSLTKDIKTRKDESKYNDILERILLIILPSIKSQLKSISILERVDVVMAYLGESGINKKKVTRLKKGKRAKKKRR